MGDASPVTEAEKALAILDRAHLMSVHGPSAPDDSTLYGKAAVALRSLLAYIKTLEAERTRLEEQTRNWMRVIDQSEDRAERAEATLAKLRSLLATPSDERRITWDEWLDGGLGGDFHEQLHAILDSAAVPEAPTPTEPEWEYGWVADEERRSKMSPRGPRIQIDGMLESPEALAAFPRGQRIRRRKAGPWEQVESEAGHE